VVITCGLFAMFFGFMYGEMFGMAQEEQAKLLGGFKIPILLKDAEGKALISPLEDPAHTINFLKLAIFVGVIHVGSGMVMNLINKISERQYLAAVAGPLPKLWLYYGAVYLFMTYWTNFALWGQNMGLVILLILAPLVLILLSEVIKHLPKIDIHHLPTLLGEGGFEVFETSLIFLSNSISYSRIFALALVHGGLFMALFSVAEPLMALPVIGSLIWLLIIFVGTAGILALESLIVFLHSLRLHYYEWFTKFYAADGVKFMPFKVERTYTKTED
jgi:V/A-type H+-transporting ATPase subunit I